MLGVVVGLFASQLLAGMLGWPMPISPETILIAGIFSIITDVFFGYYPVQKASRLDPIEALLYE